MVEHRRSGPRLLDAPIVFAVDGTVLLNVTHAADVELHRSDTVARLIEYATNQGEEVFIGVPLHGRDRAEALRRVANGAADSAGHVVGQRRRRERVRRRGRSDS